MIVLPALDEDACVIGLQAERRGEIGDRIVAQTMPVVMPLESIGNQALGGVLPSSALAGDELIVGRKIARRQRLGEQLDGFVASALLGRCLRGLEVGDAGGLQVRGEQDHANGRENQSLHG